MPAIAGTPAIAEMPATAGTKATAGTAATAVTGAIPLHGNFRLFVVQKFSSGCQKAENYNCNLPGSRSFGPFL